LKAVSFWAGGDFCGWCAVAKGFVAVLFEGGAVFFIVFFVVTVVAVDVRRWGVSVVVGGLFAISDIFGSYS